MYETVLFEELERLELDLGVDVWNLTVEELYELIKEAYDLD